MVTSSHLEQLLEWPCTVEAGNNGNTGLSLSLSCSVLCRVMLGLPWENYMEMTSARLPSLDLKP